MAEYRQGASEQEFEMQTDNIDLRAFRRKKLARRITMILLLCAVFALAVWGGVRGITTFVEHRQEVLAERTYNTLRSAKMTGSVTIDGVQNTDIITDIVGVSLKNYDTVVVKVADLSDSKISTFNKAFPDARRVEFENAVIGPSTTALTSADILSKDLSIKVNQKTPTGINFSIGNTSGPYTYEFNDYYYLERYLGDFWCSVPGVPSQLIPKGSVIAEPAQYTPPEEPAAVAPGESQTVTLSWYSRYGNLPAGKYRVIKTLSVKTDGVKGDDYAASYTIAVEFGIN